MFLQVTYTTLIHKYVIFEFYTVIFAMYDALYQIFKLVFFNFIKI